MKKFIWIEPHQDPLGIDHDFQSSTFSDKIRGHIEYYLERNGEYRNKDECK